MTFTTGTITEVILSNSGIQKFPTTPQEWSHLIRDLDLALRGTTATFTADWAGFDSAQSSTVTYLRKGSVVTIQFPQFGSTSNATTFVSGATDVPAKIRPVSGKMGAFITRDNGTFVSGTIDVSTAGQISFGAADLSGLGGFQNTGDKGFRGTQTFTYLLD